MLPYERRRWRERSFYVALLLGLALFAVLLLAGRAGRDGDPSAAPRRATTTTSSTVPGDGTTTSSSPTTEFDSAPVGVDPATGEVDGGLLAAGSCTGRAVVEVVTRARLAQEGVTLDELATTSNLRNVGIEADEAIVSGLASRFGACHTIALLARGHIGGLRAGVSGGGLDCIAGTAEAQPSSARAAAELVAGTATALYVEVMTAGLEQCLGTVQEVVLGGFERQRDLSADQRACVEAEVARRLAELARGIASLDPEMGARFFEIGSACR